MTPRMYEQVNELFHAALEVEPGERAAYLTEACGGDQELLSEVERLLAGHERAGNFLNIPAVEAASEFFVKDQVRSPASPLASSLIGRQIGHYRINLLLGKGGMGEVYLARDLQLDRNIAIKFLPAEFTWDQSRVQRFEREARAASALNHPNIITIHEIGQADGLHFIATEFIDGQTLRQRIEEGEPKLLEALEIAAQATNALSAAHAAGIIHRDIKPENIMLRLDGYVKVLDFGLAKLIERRPGESGGKDSFSEYSTAIHSVTSPGTILGTVSYMSPEQARGLRVDARSDLWSLGVVLYEMLSGRPPFQGDSQTDVLVSILEREPKSLKDSLPGAPSDLDKIVRKALAKDLNARYQTARELRADLEALKHSLVFESELERSGRSLPPLPKEIPAADVTTQQPEQIRTPWRSRLWIAAGLLIVLTVSGSIAWSLLRPSTYYYQSSATAPAQLPAAERLLSYSFTLQKMRDGKPYQEPFESYGQGFFEGGWKFRINLSSPQDGFLYLLNEAEGNVGPLYMIFPIPTFNNGQAHLEANQTIQSGWYVISERPGSEKLWFVWSAQPVRELEAVRGVVNPQDQGLISNQDQAKAVREFIRKHEAAKPETEKDKVSKRTSLRLRGDILVALVELEHH
jgi:serine/threonine protein kinase